MRSLRGCSDSPHAVLADNDRRLPTADPRRTEVPLCARRPAARSVILARVLCFGSRPAGAALDKRSHQGGTHRQGHPLRVRIMMGGEPRASSWSTPKRTPDMRGLEIGRELALSLAVPA
jgi:hypothetical protein